MHDKIVEYTTKAKNFLIENPSPLILKSKFKDFRNPQSIESPFVSSLLLTIMKTSDATNDDNLIRLNTKYLLSTKKESFVWYFSSSTPYPDLDSTICALSALRIYDFKELNYERIAQNLIRYQTEDGFFWTWLTDNNTLTTAGKENDIDIVVNTNVLFFYSLLGRDMSKLTNAISHYIATYGLDPQKKSSYYTSQFVFSYFLSRCLRYSVSSIDRKLVLDKLVTAYRNKHSEMLYNPLEAGLALNSFLDLSHSGPEIEELVSVILEVAHPQNLSKIYSMFKDPSGFQYGSHQLTVAICYEALCKYLQKF